MSVNCYFIADHTCQFIALNVLKDTWSFNQVEVKEMTSCLLHLFRGAHKAN